ncbi:MAG: ion transporter [Rhodospirillales bacterium]|nr:ion transporter [Rhodospirillales bacterium]
MTNSARYQMWRILEGTAGRWGRLINGALGVLILVNVTAEIIATVPGIDEAYHAQFFLFEIISVGIFSLEYLARLWVCVDDPRDRFHHPIKGRLRYMATPMAIVDLVAVLPLLLGVIAAVDLRFLRLARLLKLLRYSSALDLLFHAIRSERRTLTTAGVVMLVLLVTLSSIVYLIERDVQPAAFGSIPAAMWWGVVTLTTVGYGDVVPQTALGKLVGALTTMLGFGMFALPAGILASAFAQEVKRRDFVITWTMVAKVPLFAQLNAARIADIVDLLKPRIAVPGERLVRKDDLADAMYFILSGEVEVELPKGAVRLKAGDFFGEIALIARRRRTATVRAVSSCQFLELDASVFAHMLAEHPELQGTVNDVAKQRLAELEASDEKTEG